MQTRNFDEMISRFNCCVSEMDISTECKMQLLGMVAAIGFAHKNELNAQPTIEPERKKGKWSHFGDKDWLRDDGQPVFIICSECQNYVLNNASINWNFCPNCGADMRGEQE